MHLMIADEAEARVEDLRPASDAALGHGDKTSRRTRTWRDPREPRIEVPYRVAAAIAVMEMGISEYSVIASAVGLTIEEVERVDMVEDPAVRQLALARIPAGELFRLSRRVRCPKCQANVGLVPCIACRSD
jgi:hypothetical protein